MMQPKTESLYPNALTEKLLQQRIVVLDLMISDEVATEVIAKMLFLQSQSSRNPIRLLIDSPGGFITAGMAILDTIRELNPPVHTCCMGEAYAIAAVILASGTRGERSAVRTAMIGFRKPESPLNANRHETERITQLLIGRTLQITAMSEELLRDLFASARDLMPAQAVDLGIIDHILEQCIPPLN
jgi:ATP-dependent Clp protease protease subunit